MIKHGAAVVQKSYPGLHNGCIVELRNSLPIILFKAHAFFQKREAFYLTRFFTLNQDLGLVICSVLLSRFKPSQSRARLPVNQ